MIHSQTRQDKNLVDDTQKGVGCRSGDSVVTHTDNHALHDTNERR